MTLKISICWISNKIETILLLFRFLKFYYLQGNNAEATKYHGDKALS